jgi:hypothetical protein
MQLVYGLYILVNVEMNSISRQFSYVVYSAHPESKLFPIWTSHNELYRLKFPPGRTDIKGHHTNHATEIHKTFLGLIFEASIIYGLGDDDHVMILDSNDSDEESKVEDSTYETGDITLPGLSSDEYGEKCEQLSLAQRAIAKDVIPHTLCLAISPSSV